MTPKSEAIAFRAWVEAEKVGWNLTVKECAELIGVQWRVLYMIVQQKQWLNRFRVTKRATW